MQLDLGPVFSMDTRRPGVRTFGQFWDVYCDLAPQEMSEMGSFDAVSLALAGSVDGKSAVLPNIDWDLCETDCLAFSNLHLLNDFVAQGYALTVPGALENLEVVRAGQTSGTGCIALVGAGTGLGHCALHPQICDDVMVAGSEAGHATFAFQGEQEKAIERRWLKDTGKLWLSNDDVVSGPGAARLHACLCGEAVTPAQALANMTGETARVFSRFYARACRNFCLTVFPVSCLVLSGGVAIRNPHLVRSPAFEESFNDGGEYHGRLTRIPIRLNSDPHSGIRGAAIYAARCMETSKRERKS